jgi:hypothetical protein
MLFAVLEDRRPDFLGRLGVVPQHDERLDFLNLIRVRHADHAAREHLLVRVDHVFDLGRIDAVAGRYVMRFMRWRK